MYVILLYFAQVVDNGENIMARRSEFWATRVEGSTVAWQAIKAACEAILDGDKALALAILDASCISVQGENIEQCYDEQGRLYNVPLFLFTHPRPPKTNKDNNKVVGKDGNGMISKLIGSDGHSNTHGQPLILPVRVNPGEIKMEINTSTTATVHTLKGLVEQHAASRLVEQEKEGISGAAAACEVYRQRVMFLGKELRDEHCLGDVNFDGNVVQIFLRPANAVVTISS